MERQQYKYTLNNIDNNMSPTKPSDSTRQRPEHINADEADDKDLKITF